MPAIDLRELVVGDLDRVAAIERDTFADPWSRKSFAGMLGQAHIIAIAAVDDRDALVGYAMGSVAADEGEVLNIAVAKGARGAGIGRRLLDGLLARLRKAGAESFYLEVRRSNEPAIALYRSAGFRPLGVRPAYYTSPREDALTMALESASQNARKG